MFIPRERPLITKELLMREKKRHIPPPGTYEASKGDKPLLGHSDKSVKSASHIDTAVHNAKQTPSVCYKDVKSLTNCTKPRIFALKIPDAKTTAADMHRKPKKSTEPDMGSYEPGKVKEF